MRARLLISILIQAIMLASCNMPSSEPQYDFDQLATFAAQTRTASGTAGSDPSPQASATPGQDLSTPSTQIAGTGPTAEPTQTGTPCNRASFVADVTVPDGTTFFVEKPFTKIWRLKNAGTCAWTSAYQLVFDSGYRMSGPVSQPLTTGTVAPGETLEISVNLIAPSLAGTYRSNWKIKTPSGETFALSSGPFWVQIKTKQGGVVVWRTLKQGDTSPEVYALQYLLRHHDFSLLVDGTFGSETREKVKAFQNRNNIDEDGFVGPDTWDVLAAKTNVSQGSANDAARAAQYLLKQKFGYDLEVDGIFGPITAAAVKDFQLKQGLTDNGIVDALTWHKLIGK